jgi:hypothetical protein
MFNPRILATVLAILGFALITAPAQAAVAAANPGSSALLDTQRTKNSGILTLVQHRGRYRSGRGYRGSRSFRHRGYRGRAFRGHRGYNRRFDAGPRWRGRRFAGRGYYRRPYRRYRRGGIYFGAPVIGLYGLHGNTCYRRCRLYYGPRYCRRNAWRFCRRW